MGRWPTTAVTRLPPELVTRTDTPRHRSQPIALPVRRHARPPRTRLRPTLRTKPSSIRQRQRLRRRPAPLPWPHRFRQRQTPRRRSLPKSPAARRPRPATSSPPSARSRPSSRSSGPPRRRSGRRSPASRASGRSPSRSSPTRSPAATRTPPGRPSARSCRRSSRPRNTTAPSAPPSTPSTPRPTVIAAMHEALARLGVPDERDRAGTGLRHRQLPAPGSAGHALHRRRAGLASPAASPRPSIPTTTSASRTSATRGCPRAASTP